MKNDKIIASLQRIEADEKAKERMLDKIINHETHQKVRYDHPITKWVPLMAGACLVLVVSLLMLPLMNWDNIQPYEPNDPPPANGTNGEVIEPPTNGENGTNIEPPYFPVPYNFTILENTFDFEIELLELFGDEKYMYAIFRYNDEELYNRFYDYDTNGVPEKEFEFPPTANLPDEYFPTIFEFNFSGWENVGCTQGGGRIIDLKDGYIYEEHRFAVECCGPHNPYCITRNSSYPKSISGKDFTFSIKEYKVTENGQNRQPTEKALKATFTANYEPVKIHTLDINQQLKLGNETYTLKKVEISEYTVWLYFDGGTTKVNKAISEYRINGGTKRHLFTRIDTTITDSDLHILYSRLDERFGERFQWNNNKVERYLNNKPTNKKFNITDIEALIINGQEFKLPW